MTEMIPYHQQQQTDYQAATAYLASLKSAVGRRGMLSQLRKVARILRAPDINAVNWATLNAANVRAILSALSTQNLAPASIATALNALEGSSTRGLGARHAGYRDLSAHPQHSPTSRQPTTGWAAILTPASGWR